MEIKEMAKKIKEKGGTLYLVGGAIRDEFLEMPVQDEDYCITGIKEETFCDLFPEAKKKGKAFPVFEIEKREFALARKERKTGKKHQDFEIEAEGKVTIEEDLKRRDFTINSMAKEVLSGKIIDPFKGREDIKNRRIKATSIAFAEDPLRVYRAARFACVLQFEIEEKTVKQMQKMKQELLELPKERIVEEFKKALKSKRPSIFFEVLRKANLLQIHFKEIYDLIGSLQPKEFHPEGDSYVHSLVVLDDMAKKTEDLSLRYSALVHDLGKGTTPKEIYPHHYGHEERGIALVKSLGNRVGVPKNWIKCGQVAAKEHMRGGIFGKMKPKKQVAFLERVSKSPLGLEGMQMVVDSDKMGRTEEKNYFLTIGKECLTTINGKWILQKYGKLEAKEFKEKLYQERVAWLKAKR